MKYLAFCTFFLFSVFVKAQSISFEQNALDYFMSKIFDENYKKIKALEFTGFTEDHLTNFEFGHYCFSSDFTIELALINNSLNKVLPKTKLALPEKLNLKIGPIKKNSAKRFKLSVAQANEFDDMKYVTIQLLRIHHRADIFLFELDKDGNILRWCRSGAIF